MDDHKIDHIINVFPSLSNLTVQDWALAETIQISPGTPHSINEGHQLTHAIFILSGCIRIYKISHTGREVTLYRVQAGECCVLMMASILGEMAYEASVHIESDVEALLFPVESFRQWMHMYQPLRQFIYKLIVTKFTLVSDLLEQITFGSIQERIASYLIQRLNQTGNPCGEIRITHERIGIELGTAREVVTRILKKFAQEGAITLQRGTIVIVDTQKLLSHAALM